MDVLDIVLTALSMAGGLFAWYQATGSKKARAEAAAAVERAEVQAKSSHAQAYEARKQAEATQRLADSLKAQVEAAEKAASEAVRLATAAEISNKLAENHLDEFKRIANSLRGPEFWIEQVAESRFKLIYSGEELVTVSVSNLADFASSYGLGGSLTFQPGQTVEFIAVGSLGTPMPSELILDIEGRDNPVRVPLIRSM